METEATITHSKFATPFTNHVAIGLATKFYFISIVCLLAGSLNMQIVVRAFSFVVMKCVMGYTFFLTEKM